MPRGCRAGLSVTTPDGSKNGDRRAILDWSLLGQLLMSDEKGATEDKNQKITTIKGDEVLGYEGQGREEHSGQNAPREQETLEEELADNRPPRR
jgi:hypothetical protein